MPILFVVMLVVSLSSNRIGKSSLGENRMIRKMKQSLAVVVFLGLFTAVASFADQQPAPDIHGVADKVTMNAKGPIIGFLYVEGQKGQTYDKASVRVNEKTKIQIQDGKLVKDGKMADLKNGMKVSVWFTGPVAESYPVQATAGKILIFPAVAEKK